MVPPPETALAPNSFKDRKVGLVIFGILTILMGGFSALMVPLMAWGQSMAAKSGAPQDMRILAPVFLIYGVLAVILVWLGIGSIMARRWARALLLIFSWTWLIFGSADVGIMVFVMPKVMASAAIPPASPIAAPPVAAPPIAATPVPAKPTTSVTGAGTDKDPTTYNFHASPVEVQPMITMVTIIMMTIMSVILILLPAVWVFFYRSPHVKATCEANDPVVRWTDRCPLPVIALCLWFAWGAATMLVMPMAYKGVMPLFGTFVVGPLGSAIYVVFAVFWAYAAWAMYRLDRRGWWIVFVSMILFGISAFITYSRHDLSELYTLMGYRQEMIDQIQKMGFLNSRTMSWGIILGMVPFLGYLLWVRKYFRGGAQEG